MFVKNEFLNKNTVFTPVCYMCSKEAIISAFVLEFNYKRELLNFSIRTSGFATILDMTAG